MQVSSLPYDTTSRTNVVLRLTNSGTDLNSPAKTKVSGDTGPTTVGSYMQFSGAQALRFPNSTDLHVSGTYSVEFEVYFDSTSSGSYVMTYGEGYGIGWPEWHVVQTATNLNFSSSTNNTANTTNFNFLTNYNLKQWYRIGLMFYNSMIYVYVNDIQVASATCSLPYTTTNGLAIGTDYAKYAPRNWTGKIRNLTIGKSAFWSVVTADTNTAPTPTVTSGSSFSYTRNTAVYLDLHFSDAQNNVKSYAMSGSLPSGLSFDTASGIITGTIAPGAGIQTYLVVVTATDYTNLQGTASYNIVVSA